MAEDRSLEWDGAQLLAAFSAAARWLELHADAVNALNVFPVPDGDTGTNMSLTLSGAVQDVTPDRSCAVVAERVKYWATMRGRGNSGIILSQVLRGMAQALAGHERMGASELAAALTQASSTAYQAVMKPVEGTMLTVIREAAEAAELAAAEGAELGGVLEAAARRAGESVQRTPELLKTLRDAGVVDAGGHGLALILDGMLRYMRGETVERDEAASQAPAEIAFADIHGPDDFGYCTNFVLHGVGLPFEEIRTTLAAMGQSAVIVGDDQLVKVHIHMLLPGDALNYAMRFGALAQIEITNMDAQRAALQASAGQLSAPMGELAHEPLAAQVGVVAVAPGDGFAAIFHSLNVDAVVGGGQTMNPSTEDLLEAIERLPQGDVIVLPNNSNIILAARQAAGLSAKNVQVVPSKTLPQGIAARLSFNYQAGIEENVAAMADALHHVRTAEVTSAVRDAAIDGIAVRAGQTIGLLDGDLIVAADEREQVIDQLLDRMALDEREIVTIYYGRSVERAAAEALAERISVQYGGIDTEVQEGGQPLYDYIISAE
ncbi:MAG TPA: DAK2 domain-containing protein [Roseiflexaceae bacterium]|nr:DAK2 domain-containing protein [Roseiflexaceae bacterium]